VILAVGFEVPVSSAENCPASSRQKTPGLDAEVGTQKARRRLHGESG
jgi:hypothetical protein